MLPVPFVGSLCASGWCDEFGGAPSVDWAGIAFGSRTFGLVASRTGGVATWNGSRFQAQVTPIIPLVNAVWASPTTAWVVGEGVLHFDGAAWQSLPLAGPWSSVHGTAADDVWLVGTAGRIAHWNGAMLSLVSSGTTANLNAVHALSRSAVIAAGANGVILRFQGLGWATVTSGTSTALLAIGARGPDVVVLGAQTSFRVTALGIVTPITGFTMTQPRAAVETPAGLWVFGSGNASATLHDGSSWITLTPGVPLSTPTGVTLDGSRLWVSTSSGALVVVDGTQWQQGLMPAPRPFIEGLHVAADGALSARSTEFLVRGDAGWVTDTARTAAFQALRVRAFCARNSSEAFAVGEDGGLFAQPGGPTEPPFTSDPTNRLVCGAGGELVASVESHLGVAYALRHLRTPDGGWLSSFGYDYNLRLFTAFDGGIVGGGESCASDSLGRMVCQVATGSGPEVRRSMGTTFFQNTSSRYHLAESATTRFILRDTPSSNGLYRDLKLGIVAAGVASAQDFVAPSSTQGIGAIDDRVVISDGTSIGIVSVDGGLALEALPRFFNSFVCSPRTRQCWAGGTGIWRRDF